MGIAADIIDRANELASDRIYWVNVWMDIARMVLPTENPETSFSLMQLGVNRIGVQGPLPGALCTLVFREALQC